VHPDAKIIITTQYKDKELEQEAMSSGAYNFLLKENLYELESMLTTKTIGEIK
jgi:DNA-binding NarL/FixJ family response regulator